jgi:hypothetical protein
LRSGIVMKDRGYNVMCSMICRRLSVQKFSPQVVHNKRQTADRTVTAEQFHTVPICGPCPDFQSVI